MITYILRPELANLRVRTLLVPVLSNHGGQAPLVLLPGLAHTEPPAPLYSHTSAALHSLTPESVARPTPSFVDIPTPLVDVPQQRCHPRPQQTPDKPTSGAIHQHDLSVPSNKELTNTTETQMRRGKRVGVALASTFLSLFTVSQVYQHTHHQGGSEGLEENEWIASSRSWMERKTCQWFGFCGITHLNRSKWVSKSHRKAGDGVQEALTDKHTFDLSEFWTSGKSRPEDWSEDERALREIPQYVLDHAPLMHLFSGEKFWPCDIADHLIHTTPHLNYTPLQAKSDHPNLTNLDELNDFGRFVYLQSDDNVEERPAWLGGESNVPTKPDSDDDDDDWARYPDWDGRVDGELPDEHDRPWYEAGIGDTRDKGGERPNPTAPNQARPTDTVEGEELLYEDGYVPPADREPRMVRRTLDWTAGKKHGSPGGRSDAPAVLVAIDKGHGVVDAFWFFFYSYNLGNVVLNVRFGNHVGDWEHTVVRFHHGKPKAVFFSEHSFGEAYAWEAVEKIGKRVSFPRMASLSSPYSDTHLLNSLWATSLLARMRSTQRQEHILTFCPGACCTTSPTAAHSGIPLSTFIATPMIIRTTS